MVVLTDKALVNLALEEAAVHAGHAVLVQSDDDGALIMILGAGNTKGKYHCTIDLLFDWFGLVCFANKAKIVSCHTAESKPVKQEVNGTVILPPLVFPAWGI